MCICPKKAVGHLLLIAESSVQGIFVAPRTRIPSLSTPTPEWTRGTSDVNCFGRVLSFKLTSSSPCICTRNSVLILRAASLSFSLLEPHKESISSMKMMDGLFSRANVNRFFTNLGGRLEIKRRRKTLKCANVFNMFQGQMSHDHKALLFTFAQPLGDEVGGWDGEEGGVIGFCGHRFGKVRLPCSWRTKEKDPPPRSALSYSNTCIRFIQTFFFAESVGLIIAFCTSKQMRKFNGQNHSFL